MLAHFVQMSPKQHDVVLTIEWHIAGEESCTHVKCVKNILEKYIKSPFCSPGNYNQCNNVQKLLYTSSVTS